RMAEWSDVDQRRLRRDPDAVEAQERKQRGKSSQELVLSEVLLQPAERPAARPPLVQIAHDDRDASALFGDGGEKFFHLASPLVGAQAEMRDDHAHDLAVHVEIDVGRGARLVARDGQVEMLDVQYAKAREQGVAEFAGAPLEKAA